MKAFGRSPWNFLAGVRPLALLALCIGAAPLTEAARAQSTQLQNTGVWWSSYYDEAQGGDDFAYDVAIDGAYRLVTAGRIQPPGPATAGRYLAHSTVFTSAGLTDWSVTLGVADADAGFWGVGIDAADNIVLAGYGGFDATVRKYPAAGPILVWEAVWPGTASTPQSIQELAIGTDGAIHLANNSTNGFFGGWSEWALLRLDAQGSRTLGPVNYNTPQPDVAYAIAVDDSDGSFVAAGIVGTASAANDDWHVRKYDAAGSLLWSDTFSGAAGLHDYATGVAIDAAGDVYICGYTNRGTDNDAGQDFDWLVIKYARDGDGGAGRRLWTYTYASAPGRNETCRQLALLPDGNVLVAGRIVDDEERIRPRVALIDASTGSQLDELVLPADNRHYVAHSIATRGLVIALAGAAWIDDSGTYDTFVWMGSIPPARPRVTTNGGQPIVVGDPELLLEGTVDPGAEALLVNGVRHDLQPGQNTWQIPVTLNEGDNAIEIAAVNAWDQQSETTVFQARRQSNGARDWQAYE